MTANKVGFAFGYLKFMITFEFFTTFTCYFFVLIFFYLHVRFTGFEPVLVGGLSSVRLPIAPQAETVDEVGLEPTNLAVHDFKSCVYTIPPLVDNIV